MNMTKLNRAIRIGMSGGMAALLICAALTGVCADAAPSVQPRAYEVGSNSLTLYADRSLRGAQNGTLSKGDRISAAPNGDGSCTVYDEGGELLGYCSPVDLVTPGTPLFVQVPYLYSTDLLGEPLFFDLIDLDLYLSENASDIYRSVPESGEEKTVLICRRMLGDLEEAADELAKAGITLWVDEGYRPDGTIPVRGMAAYNTGCVLNLTLIRDNLRLGQNPNSAAYIQARNILRLHGFYPSETDSLVFCYDDFESCLGVDLDVSSLPRTTGD